MVRAGENDKNVVLWHGCCVFFCAAGVVCEHEHANNARRGIARHGL